MFCELRYALYCFITSPSTEVAWAGAMRRVLSGQGRREEHNSSTSALPSPAPCSCIGLEGRGRDGVWHVPCSFPRNGARWPRLGGRPPPGPRWPWRPGAPSTWRRSCSACCARTSLAEGQARGGPPEGLRPPSLSLPSCSLPSSSCSPFPSSPSSRLPSSRLFSTNHLPSDGRVNDRHPSSQLLVRKSTLVTILRR